MSSDHDAEAAFAKYEQYVNPALARLMRFLGLADIEVQGKGAVICDSSGKEYIDCSGGFGVFFHGHRHPRIVNAVKKQLDTMPLSSRLLIGSPAGELAELLAQVTPGDLQYSFFCNSGAEAIEAAIKFARITTNRELIISTHGAFHGKTLGALTVSGRDQYKQGFGPLLGGVDHIPYNDKTALEDVITERTAALLLEPIQGENGVIVPDDDYLAYARELCTNAGALLILDEVQTGMGRTGKMFACEHYNVTPDILCLAKALGGGVVPIGAVVGTPQVWEFFSSAPLLHTSTFGGNHVCCAAGVEAIKVIKDEDLLTAAQTKGKKCLNYIKDIQQQFPKIITDVRGKGLLIGMQFADEGYGGSVMSGLVQRGVLSVYTLNNQQVIRWAPPAVITDQQLDKALSALKDSIAEAAELMSDL